jgi:iron(III) transport system ATP-binding protein
MNSSGQPNQPHLRVDGVSKSYDGFEAVRDASVSVRRGETLALLGPSGCGKTTLLRMIAGLAVPDTGTISVGGRVLTGPSGVVPPERRRVGMVFQDLALFPHMTVSENVAYGVTPGDIAQGRVERALALVDLESFGDRYPDTLSGGQAQRVALARALAPKPDILLLDEPFASLDAELRTRVRSEVAALLRSLETTAVFVTHDQEEAFVIGDSIAVMREGEILQVGTPSDIYDMPASPWIARFVGEANVLDATFGRTGAATVVGSIAGQFPDHGAGQVMLRPEALQLGAGGDGVVRNVEFYGHDTSYTVDMSGTQLLIRQIAAPTFRVGDRVAVRHGGGRAHLFSQQG